MPTLDETLCGRIAVFNGYLRQDQLEECLALQRAAPEPRFLGDILLERGYLTKEQLNTILAIRRKKSRKRHKKPDESRDANRSFGALATQAGLISLEHLEAAILEQQRLAQLNLQFCLGEVLVSQGKLKTGDVLRILNEQGKTILMCPVCEAHFNVLRTVPTKTYKCLECEAPLIQPRFLDTVAVDGVIEE